MVVEKRFCSVSGCGRPHDSRDLCGTHLARLKRFGDVMEGKPIGYRNKLSYEIAGHIREDSLAGIKTKQLSQKYGVTEYAIQCIVRGVLYK